MHAVMRTILIVAIAGLAAQAHAQSRPEHLDRTERRAALEGIELFVSPAEGMLFMSRNGRLLAAGALAETGSMARNTPYGGGYQVYEECVPGYGCRTVGDYGDPYYAPGYADYGGGYSGYGLPDIVLSGRDLTLKPVTHASLPLSQAGPNPDITMDHWRIRYERTGRLDTNPSPLISTAAMLAPVAGVDPVTTASVDASAQPSGPVEIAIVRRNAREATADIQKLLNAMGHDAGRPDGLAGRNTEAAIRRFQAARGIEVTGRLTASLVDAIYLAADKKLPATGTITVRRRGKLLLQSPVDIDDDTAASSDTADNDARAKRDDDRKGALGTHLFTQTGKASGWQLFTLSKDNAAFAGEIFGYTGKQAHEAAAAQALSRIHLPAEIRAKLAALAVPGSTLSLSDERLPDPSSRRY